MARSESCGEGNVDCTADSRRGSGARSGRLQGHARGLRVRALTAGDTADCWRVEPIKPGERLRLVAEMELPYRAWLDFEIQPDGDGARLQQKALFDLVGLWGFCGHDRNQLPAGVIEDTSDLDFSGHRKTRDWGVIGDGDGRGFELHSALAVRVESWTLEQRPEGQVMGLFDQQCRRPRPAPRGETRRERLSRRRKSSWWAEALQRAGSPPEGCRWIYLADRESDFYEPIQICQRLGVDFIIRACHDRRLAEGVGKLTAALAGAAVLGQSTVELRSRRGEAARTAIVELRSVPVDLDGPWRPGGWQEPLRAVTGVEVREVHAPEEVEEPLHWILLTSLPCRTLAQARQIVGRYTARWWVEEYHKAIKSGAGVEDSQLENGGRLEPLIAVLAVVAVRLLNAKMLARSRPEGSEARESFGPEALEILEKRFGKPKGGGGAIARC